MIRKRICVLWALLLSININFLVAQDTICFDLPNQYGFENIAADSIGNARNLSILFSKLYLNNQNPFHQIQILQIGDSHMQADYISHTIRTELQKVFGNAGRGLITPLKVAKTNEPFNYKTGSSSLWVNQKCISKKGELPIGIGGICIKSIDSNAFLYLKTFDTPGMDYSFEKLRLFNYVDSNSFHLKIEDTLTKFTHLIKQKPFENNSLINLPSKTSQLTLTALKSDSTQSHITLFGFSLEKTQPGILYHSVGINGAKYTDYLRSKLFIKQTSLLKPELIILNLGTNEAFQKSFDTTKFYLTIDSLVRELSIQNPLTPILLTTPANSFYFKQKSKTMPLVATTIIKYAKDHNLAYWDLFEIGGGENSAISWKKNLLLGHDGVHYTKEGYIHQGNLFVKGFFNAYNQYVRHRFN